MSTTTKCTKNHSGNHTMAYDSNTGVFECAGCGHIRRKWEDEEDEANARLIAAAPELLQAIKDLFRECAMVHKYWGDGANTKEADAAIKRAKDAIAKATGQD